MSTDLKRPTKYYFLDFFAKGGGLTVTERIDQTDEIFRGHGTSVNV